MCLNPTLVVNKHFTPNRKNGFKIPFCDDKRKLWVSAPCGYCIECRKKKSNDWKIRITEEMNNGLKCWFVNLSFSNKSIFLLEERFKLKHKRDADANDVATLAIRLYFENIRKKLKVSLKHIFFTELGHRNSHRIHLHGLIWNTSNFDNNTVLDVIKSKWRRGIVFIGNEASLKTVNYIVKYLLKSDCDNPGFISKCLCSPGIGKSYLNKPDATRNVFNDNNTNECYRYTTGKKGSLPTYYRNKLYTDDERDKLWVNKLDKCERYVMGQRIDVSTDSGITEYINAVKYWLSRDIQEGNFNSKYLSRQERKVYNAMMKDFRIDKG